MFFSFFLGFCLVLLRRISVCRGSPPPFTDANPVTNTHTLAFGQTSKNPAVMTERQLITLFDCNKCNLDTCLTDTVITGGCE
jgi:hypothetical protein